MQHGNFDAMEDKTKKSQAMETGSVSTIEDKKVDMQNSS